MGKMDDQTKMQSHSAPNSPKNQKLQQPNASNHTQPILHHNKFQPLNTNKATQKIAANNKNDTEMLSIFNSLKISNKNKKISQSLCTSPHNSYFPSNKLKTRSLDSAKTGNLMECLESFEKYTNDETEIIEVLLQTLNNEKNDIFNNIVNWHDLYKNIKQRKREWIQFEQQFNSCIILKEYDEKKHEEIKQYISKKI